ncbi:MAG: ankyrin repeat domain-containing protein [Pseudohongiellaceae bacterium]|jgi:ankyrin repeat protein
MPARKPFTAATAALITALTLATVPALAQDNLPQLVEQGKRQAAMTLIENGADVNQRFADGTTALHWAAYQKDAELLALLLAEGADPNASNDYDATPMTVAAVHGDLGIMQALLEAGGDVESPNAEGQTLLMAIARTGNTATARLLLEHGANVDAREHWGEQAALMWAASQSQPAMVKLLVEFGAGVDDRSRDNAWPRYITSEPRNKPLDPGGYTPLLYAAREGCVECIAHLLDGGADINLTDLWGQTPLLMATLNMHWDAADLLIDRGADIHRWDWWGRTALYNAIDLNLIPSSRRGDLPVTDEHTALDIAGKLLDMGINADMRLKKEPPFRSGGDRGYTDASPDGRVLNGGATALHKAAKAGDVAAVKLLLSHGANVHAANKLYDVTPMLTAGGVWRVYGIFMEYPISGQYKTGTQAAEIMQLLQEAGADIHARASNGQNVAHGSAKAGWNEALQYAWEQGVDFQARDVGGMTPRDLAEMMGHTETVAFIDALLDN